MVDSLGSSRCYTSYLARYAELNERHDKCDPPLRPVGPPEAASASKFDGAGTLASRDHMFEVPHHAPVVLHEFLHIFLVVDLPNPFHCLSYIAVGTTLVPNADG